MNMINYLVCQEVVHAMEKVEQGERLGRGSGQAGRRCALHEK